MGGRGVDCVLEKVFNPARDWMRGRRTPDSAPRPKHSISGILLKKRAMKNERQWSLSDPPEAPACSLPLGISLRLVAQGEHPSGARQGCHNVMAPSIISSQNLRLLGKPH